MNKDIILRVNDQIHLKILKVSDVNESYVKWLNDYEVTKYTEQRYFKHDVTRVKKFVDEKYKSENDLLFGIYFENLHIGNIKLGPIIWEHKSANISYIIGNKSFWRKGIATLCIKKILQYAIEKYSIKKIKAQYYELNMASKKVLEKCGFVIEGTLIKEIEFEGKRINNILVGYNHS